ncbi:MAG TPA: hypothetical protein VHB50_11510 [Bryobacteraceae bacterium]|nr:hypothetical protein [Bryobacteraceae bacterium]
MNPFDEIAAVAEMAKAARKADAEDPARKRNGGPKTPEGKDRARMNSWRHGLTGHIMILVPEERAAYEAHCKGIHDSLRPSGTLESTLAQAVADGHWRLKHANSLQNSIFALGHCGEPGNIEGPNLEVAAALGQARTWADDAHQLQLLSLYESRIRRGIEKDMAEIRRLQAERKAAEKQALEEAQLLACLAYMRNQPYDPAQDVPPEEPEPSPENEFVCSAAAINYRIDRELRLTEARFFAAHNWDRKILYHRPGIRVPLAA